MKTVYVETPVSEKPSIILEGGYIRPYFTSLGEIYWNGKYWLDAEHNSTNPEWWLKPVPVPGVPNEEIIKAAASIYANAMFPKSEDYEWTTVAFEAYKLAATNMRDELLPAIAALTAENKALSEERDRMKAQQGKFPELDIEQIFPDLHSSYWIASLKGVKGMVVEGETKEGAIEEMMTSIKTLIIHNSTTKTK